MIRHCERMSEQIWKKTTAARHLMVGAARMAIGADEMTGIRLVTDNFSGLISTPFNPCQYLGVARLAIMPPHGERYPTIENADRSKLWIISCRMDDVMALHGDPEVNCVLASTPPHVLEPGLTCPGSFYLGDSGKVVDMETLSNTPYGSSTGDRVVAMALNLSVTIARTIACREI